MEKLGRELARAYMAAYDEAMNKSMFNEAYAGQVAAIVTMSIANRPQQAAPMTSRIFEMLLKPADPKPEPEKKPEQKKDPKKKEGGKDEQRI